MRVLKKISSVLISIFSLLTVTILILTITYIFSRKSTLTNPDVVRTPQVKYSYFTDDHGNIIKKLGSYEENYIEYNDIPKTLVDALLAIEDISYFDHDGFDLRRIFGSLYSNLTSQEVSGASTITQQLAKNLFLTPDKNMERKIDELLLSLKLEEKFSKEEILEFYFNMVFFDPIQNGITRASKKFFDKPVQALSIAECATLVGLVKSPSLLNPLKYPDAAQERRNTVLTAMYKYGYLDSNEYRHALSVDLKSSLSDKKKDQTTYDYQAYIDCCYQEVERLTGIDPYITPVSVDTYMDSNLQSFLDEISNSDKYVIDSNQQIAMTLLNNDNTRVVAVSGGKNYAGEKLYNRAYDMKRGPASTMKPIFEYALAFELLNYNKATTLNDEYTTYPDSSVVHNAGGNYLGLLPLCEALGYSKNTTAIQTLMKLRNEYGEAFLEEYLKSIHVMDEGPFTLAYGLGGMTYGVSPLNMAGAYAMLANNGVYQEPAFIKRITLLNDQKVIYVDNRETNQVLKETTAGMMTDLLTEIVDENFVGLKSAKPLGVQLAAKTGTTAYDYQTIQTYHYPSSVDRDLWLIGYTPNYTLSVWTGFDKPLKEETTYFYKGDKRRALSKKLFLSVMDFANIKGNKFKTVEGLQTVPLVKYAEGNYLPNGYIPSSYVIDSLVKEGEVYEEYPLPILPEANPSIFIFDDHITFVLNELPEADQVYKRIYGNLGYHITIYENSEVIQKSFVTGENYDFYHGDSDTLEYEIKVGYEKLSSLYGIPYSNVGQSMFTPW